MKVFATRPRALLLAALGSVGWVSAEIGSIRGELVDVTGQRKLPPGISCKKVFNFNMIAHNDPNQPSCDNNGKRIFIQKNGSSRIEVYQDTGTYDIDCDQGNGGDKYSLSVPEVGTFDVYVRALGKPGGTLNIEVCNLYDTGDCLVDEFSIKRESGKSSFRIATNQLFSDEYKDLLWTTITNKDFKIAQFWFCNN